MEERQESRNRAIGQLGDMFDREIAGTENGVDLSLIHISVETNGHPLKPK